MRQKEKDAKALREKKGGPGKKPDLLVEGRVYTPRIRDVLNHNLLQAAKRRQWGRASALLEAGATPDARDELGYTALTYAAADGQKGLVEFMVGQGAKVSIMDIASRVAYLKACIGGHTEISEVLLGAGDFLDEDVQHRNAPRMNIFMREEAMELIASIIEAYEEEE